VSSRPGGQARVVVIDGQPLFRESIVRALGRSTLLRVVGEASSGRAGLAAILSLVPEVAVIDADAPDLDGLGVLAGLARERSLTRGLLLATDIPPDRAYAGMVEGAAGYVTRSISAEELRATVTAVAAGETVLAADAQTALAAELVARRGEQSLLTPRQLRILGLAADGHPTAGIAATLRVSVSAVKSDLAVAYDRLDVPDRASAVAAALRRGLIR
jgi:two-component system nitrate/nitrite response regulator NarL